jgi:site-specific DNA-methyltransferase (adenine-specific)
MWKTRKAATMPTPYWQGDGITLYLGDCRELAEWLAADVLVTDPPYGIGWSQGDYAITTRPRSNRQTPHPGIVNDIDTSARDAALAAWGDRPGLMFGAIDRPFPAGTRRVLVWRKPADSGLMGSIRWRKDWEPIFMIGRWPQIPATESSVLTAAAGSHRQYAQGVHPHAKPVDLMERLLAGCPPGVVADPFAGSGSTLIAARNAGRAAIGIEIDERYCQTIAARLSQSALFTDAQL